MRGADNKGTAQELLHVGVVVRLEAVQSVVIHCLGVDLLHCVPPVVANCGGYVVTECTTVAAARLPVRLQADNFRPNDTHAQTQTAPPESPEDEPEGGDGEGEEAEPAGEQE